MVLFVQHFLSCIEQTIHRVPLFSAHFSTFPVNLILTPFNLIILPPDLSREHILEVFGDYFLVYCLRHGYDDMLRTLGNDMAGFLQSLDSLHSLLALTYDNMSAPSFRWVDLHTGDKFEQIECLLPEIYGGSKKNEQTSERKEMRYREKRRVESKLKNKTDEKKE